MDRHELLWWAGDEAWTAGGVSRLLRSVCYRHGRGTGQENGKAKRDLSVIESRPGYEKVGSM